MDDSKVSVSELRRDISELSSQLKNLSESKEAKYQTISEYNSKLNDLLKLANELKDKKAQLDKVIKESKQKRDVLNQKVSKISLQIKELMKAKEEPHAREENPNLLRKRLDDLEMKMQTEVVKFDKEQKLMSLIKEIRAKLKSSVEAEKVSMEFVSAKRLLREAKLDADIAHHLVQESAAKNSEIFRQLSDVSKQIADMKSKRDILKKEVTQLKNDIHRYNQKLAEALSSWSTQKTKFSVDKQKAVDELIAQKVEVVREKLAKKEKITTGDILAMQRQGMGK